MIRTKIRRVRQKSASLPLSTSYQLGRLITVPVSLSAKKSRAIADERTDSFYKEYKKNRNPGEIEELALYGSLDLGKDLKVLTPEQEKLRSDLAKKYKPLVMFDRKHNPHALRQIWPLMGLAGAQTGLSLSVAGLGKIFKENPEKIEKMVLETARKLKIPLRELKVIKKVPYTFISKADVLRKRIFTVPVASTALHELGHLKDFSSKLGKLKMLGVYSAYNLPRIGALLNKIPIVPPIPLLSFAAVAPLLSKSVRGALAGKDKKSLRHKIIKGIEKHPYLTSLAMYAGLMRSEAAASAFALKQLVKRYGIGRGLLKGSPLLAAFGTYLALPLAAGWGLKKLFQWQAGVDKAREQGLKNLAKAGPKSEFGKKLLKPLKKKSFVRKVPK